jgi:hypothetical protein
MGSRWSIREGYGGLMSAQSSVERAVLLSGFIDGGVKLPLLHTQCAPANYASTLAGEALEIWAIQTKALKGKT